MSGSRGKELPPPDTSGTSIDTALTRRFSLGVAEAPVVPARTSKPKNSRPDPVGMKRASFYVTAASADRVEAAADAILAILGPDTPRHVALTALLEAAAAQAANVAQELIERRTTDLAAALAKMKNPSG